MNLKFEVMKNCLVVHLSGELDHHSAEEVRTKIDDRIIAGGVRKVVMDFSGVTFMDSSGIGAVIGRYKRISESKGTLCIAGIRNSVKKVFELSGMFKIIKCYEDVNEAIANI